jgi:hypothetical protein
MELGSESGAFGKRVETALRAVRIRSAIVSSFSGSVNGRPTGLPAQSPDGYRSSFAITVLTTRNKHVRKFPLDRP